MPNMTGNRTVAFMYRRFSKNLRDCQSLDPEVYWTQGEGDLTGKFPRYSP